ncbi:MAG: dihydropteroate synthase [Planctomycetes bacterium]|nr:dihydropteroate synthase [Planctomycetota bacterium]
MPFPGLTIIGERINPGFASSKRLLDARDVGQLQELARTQVAKGAALVNVNGGTEGERDPAWVAQLVQAVQAVVTVPLSIDSPSAAVQERALRAYDPARSGGRGPILNSVTENRWDLLALRNLVPGGAQVLFMASERLEGGQAVPNRSGAEVHETARRMAARARAEQGMANHDIILDVSVAPLATDTEGLARMAVEAIRLIGADPDLRGVHLSVGLSNIGIMLPKVEVGGIPIGLALECAFLTLCVPAGLDMSLATAGRDYRVLPDGHPALEAFKECVAAEDGFESLGIVKQLYRNAAKTAAAGAA